MAFDPTSRFHFEVGGIVSTFKIALNQNAAGAVSIAAPYNLHPHHHRRRPARSAPMSAVLKNLRLISTNLLSDGEGRYLFGQAPDSGVAPTAHSAHSVRRHDRRLRSHNQEHSALRLLRRDLHRPRTWRLDANGTSFIGYGYRAPPTARTARSRKSRSVSTRPSGRIPVTAPST